MSSYFDQAAKMITEALEANDRRFAWDIAATAVNRYGSYMYSFRGRISEVDGVRWTTLYAEWQWILDGMTTKSSPSETIERLHDLAHKLGTEHFVLSDGSTPHDNPYGDGRHDAIQDGAFA